MSRLCCSVGKAEAVEGKCSNLARKDFLRWRLRPRCCDLWGLAQPRLHPHTHTHMSHPQVSQPFYPRTFGLGILFWCLGSPARMAEPTIAAVCSTAHPKKLLTSSIIPLAPEQILPSSSAPSRAKPFRPSLHKTSFHILISSLCLNLVTFLPCSGQGSRGSTHPQPRVLEPARSVMQEPTFSFLSLSFPWFQAFSSSLSP